MNENQSDRQIRAAFEGSYRPPGPGFDARMRAGLTAAPPPAARNIRTLGLIAVILVVATILVLALPRLLALTTPVPGHRTQAAIPWLPLPPDLVAPIESSPSPSPLPLGTRPCSSAQVKVTALGGNGAGGHIFQGFGFAGRGPGACFLEGTPAVELFDRSGRKLPFKTRPSFLGPDPVVPVLLEPEPLPNPNTNLQLGQAAVSIDWVTQPEQCPGSAAVQIASVGISLAGRGPALTVALSPAPEAYACQGLGVGTFSGPTPPVVEPTPTPLPALTMKAPASVRAGQDLIYLVTLTNDTFEPMDLIANCPAIEEQLVSNDTLVGPLRARKPGFQLNCKPAGTIQSGASRTFEIRLAVPHDAAPGSYTLSFAIAYWDTTSNPVSAPVKVTL